MELDFQTPALLFPAISLLFIAYTNRFVAYANLVRRLHDRWMEDGNPVLQPQIRNLRRRIALIRGMQVAGAAGLLLAVLCMTMLFFGLIVTAEVIFVGALLCMLVSLGLLLVEAGISERALQYQLDELSGGR